MHRVQYKTKQNGGKFPEILQSIIPQQIPEVLLSYILYSIRKIPEVLLSHCTVKFQKSYYIYLLYRKISNY